MAVKKKAVSKESSRVSVVAQKTRDMISKTFHTDTVEAHHGQYPHISSGSVVVDNLIGSTLAEDGKPTCPGFPRRKISEVSGSEASGKTSLALGAVREVQKAGGVAMILDYEKALDRRYAKAIGVDFSPDKLLLYEPSTLEQGFKYMYVGISQGIDLIVVDSVAAMLPEELANADLDAHAMVGSLARKMSQFLPRLVDWLAVKPSVTDSYGVQRRLPEYDGTAVILLNQERATISRGPSFMGPQTSSTGGKALKFYATIRLSIARIKSEYVQVKDKATGKTVKRPYGNETRVKVMKNKLDGKGGYDGSIFIRHNFGVDDILSMIKTGESNKILTRAGAKYSYKGETYSSRDEFRRFLLSNPKLASTLRQEVMGVLLDNATPATDEDLTQSDAEILMEKELEDLMGTEEEDPEEVDPDLILPEDG